MKKLYLSITLLSFFLSFFSVKSQTYCSSYGDSSQFLDITLVEVNSAIAKLQNYTPLNSLAGTYGSGTGSIGRYSNFTATPNIPIPIFPRGYGQYVSVKRSRNGLGGIGQFALYFDWNKDGDFVDANEKFFTNNFLFDSVRIFVNVPTSAALGTTRMRVVARKDTVIANYSPCTTGSSTTNEGETEDYNIEVADCINKMNEVVWKEGSTSTSPCNGYFVIDSMLPNTRYIVEYKIGTTNYSVVRRSDALGYVTVEGLCNDSIHTLSIIDECNAYQVSGNPSLLSCSGKSASISPSGSVTSTLGSSINLSSTSSGGSASMNWYLRGTVIVGATSGNYNISSLAYLDTGCYFARYTFTNGCVLSTSKTCVNVSTAPSSCNCPDTTITTLKNTPKYIAPCLNYSGSGYSVSVFTYPPKSGTTSVDTLGYVTYIPNTNFVGRDTFYKITCISFPNGSTCCDTSRVYVIIEAPKVPSCSQYKNFNYTKSGTSFYFSPSGTVPSPYTARYNWIFSNGQTSTLKNPVKTFTTNYNWARLIICIDSGTTNICCDSSFVDSIMLCKMSCYITKMNDSLKVTASGGIAPRTYIWSTGTTGERIKAVNAGTYSVTVMDSVGCTSICSYTISACTNYKNFTYTDSGSHITYHFYGTAASAPYVLGSTYWIFGDGTISTSANPTHTYDYTGTYKVTYRFCLIDSNLNTVCCDSISKTISVNIPYNCNIQANFGYYSLTNAGTFRFIDSTEPTASNYTYSWSFGDSSYSSQKNPEHTYKATGTYVVRLIVCKWLNASNQTCCDTITKTIIVTAVNPCNRFIPNFSYSSSGANYTFTNTTNMTNFNLVSISYKINNLNTTYTTATASHNFMYNGYYSVTMTLTVYDVLSGTNCTKTITKYLSVNTSICGCLKAYNTYTKSGMMVNFTNASSCTDSTTTYLYKFGNGATSTGASPSYIYSLPGLYRTVMYVTRTVGATSCMDSFVRIIQISTTNPCKDSGYTTYYTYPCSDYISPVCGCDSITYKNYCYATREGVKQYRNGPCANDTMYVKICGNVYLDMDNDCAIDSFDLPLAYRTLKVNTTPIRYVYTNSLGYYQIYLPKGTYQISQVTNYYYPPLGQLCPASNASITVAATTAGATYCNNNFYDTASTCPDLSVSLYRTYNITPGFYSGKSIKYENKGATALSGVVLKYRFLSGLTPRTTAPVTSPTYTVSGNVISWNLGTLAPYSTGWKQVYLNVPTTLALGTTVIDSAWIEPISGDCVPSNNLATRLDTCVGSWDPNDKAAYPANDIDTSVQELNYHVRFQNTGTAPAHNVRIEDYIDNNLNKSSLQIKGSSHNMNHFFDETGKLTFEFPNIMLPDSGTDYDASQGFVDYSIRLNTGLAVGTQLKNTANIYFDFNEAVITNTTINTIRLKSSSSVRNIGKDMNISLYPNPTTNKAILQIVLDKSSVISYVLYDLQGKIITGKPNSKVNGVIFTDEINFEFLPKGIYLLQVEINGKQTPLKIMKE